MNSITTCLPDVELLANAADPEEIDPHRTEPDLLLPNLLPPDLAYLNPPDSSPLSYEPPMDGMAEICLYRRRTINLLRRYAKLSIETGRLASALSAFEFQSRITTYPLLTFEDAVIFVFDVERCLGELDEFEYAMIARVVLRAEPPEEAARAMQCCPRSIFRNLPDALDKLSKKFLRRGVLRRSEIQPKSCQEAENGVFDVSS